MEQGIAKKLMIYRPEWESTDALRLFLEQEGYDICTAESEKEAMEGIRDRGIHILLMDIGEREEYVGTLSRIREMSCIPILILSANDAEHAKIAALNAGADDYVSIPFHPMELAARVNSQYRRYTQLARLCENIDHIYQVDELVVDDMRRKVTVAGREVRLTPIEYKILRLLVQERGKVLSIGQIYESIWNMQAVGADNTVAVHVRHIREKIERNPGKPRYLKVVWGTGYKVG